jgi:signal peptidase I
MSENKKDKRENVFKNLNKKSIIIIILILIISMVILAPFFLLRNKLITITSSSMNPTLKIGDTITYKEKNPRDIKANPISGDILVLKGPQYFYLKGLNPIFWSFTQLNTKIIHRAIAKKWEGNCWYFLTKGDNNYFPDGSYKTKNISLSHCKVDITVDPHGIYIPQTEVLGVVNFRIPYIGFVDIYFIPIFIIICIVLFIFLLIEISGIKIKIQIQKKGKELS